MDATELRQAATAYRRASDAAERARATLIRGVVEAHGEGMRVADIVRATDHLWTREWVGKLVSGAAEHNGARHG